MSTFLPGREFAFWVAMPHRQKPVRSRLIGSRALVGLIAVFAYCGLLVNGCQAEPKDVIAAERNEWRTLDDGIRVLVNRPGDRAGVTAARKTWLLLYATPNGNTIEQTLGCSVRSQAGNPGAGGTVPADIDWRYDIQHVAAQTRRLREVDPDRDWILAVVQAPQLSWPAYRGAVPKADARIRDLVETLARELNVARVVLAAHSGGGSFLFGYINANDDIPPSVERFAFLDANYANSDDLRHGEKLSAWMHGDPLRRLIVLAYDDREITLNGKKVVGPTGGTFRATTRMRGYFEKELTFTAREIGGCREEQSPHGQVRFCVHPNHENKILHTAFVGEMNGLLYAVTAGTPLENQWRAFGGPRAYTAWVSESPLREAKAPRGELVPLPAGMELSIPPRPEGSPVGSEFVRQIAGLGRSEREAAVRQQLLAGNIPPFLRSLKAVRVERKSPDGANQEVIYGVMPDYLAIGNDGDFVRIPITPATANAVADQFAGGLMTRKISDDVHDVSELRLAPRPMTKDRDQVDTFLEHHRIVEDQFGVSRRGALVAGIKKDVVLTNRLREKPHKVAIYGWHYPDGRPIQPLYVGHVDWYVDYSHGVRLIAGKVLVNGVPRAIVDVLKDPDWCWALSDEGPIDAAEIRRLSEW